VFAERLALIFSAGSPAAALEADRLQCEAETWVRLARADEWRPTRSRSRTSSYGERRRDGASSTRLRRLWRRLSAQDRAAFLLHVSEGRAA
jgi:hypothetical protein